VPVDKKVRIVTTANDVIHAWMVPALGVKQDAIPGFVRDTWFRAEKTGDFYGQCAELCGKEHAYMPIHVKVLSQADYAKWVDGKKKEMAAAADDPARSGSWPTWWPAARRSTPPTAPPATGRRQGRRPDQAAGRRAVVLDADGADRHPAQRRGNGAMPAWKQLSDTEIAAVITYTKNNWSNKTGKLVQPAEVVAARK
jgi:cytochrome c oxidase subunit 2